MPAAPQELSVRGDGFEPGGRLPERFAYDKGNEVPALHISGIPSEAVELAVIVHDPDAPFPFGFTHWLLFGVPATTSVIDADANGAFRPGTNDFGDAGWGGPLPPEGHGDHHYYFWVYALDTTVEGEPTREEFLTRYGDHILEQNRVVATYSR